MKLILTVSPLVISCSEAPKVEVEPTGRIVLAELFTFARCVYCPFAEHALDSLSEEYNDSLAVIAYHRRVVGDTLSPSYIAVRESLYEIESSPTVIFDGVNKVQTEDPDVDYAVFKGWIIHERNVASRLKLALETNLIYPSVTIKLTVVTVDSIENGDYRLFLVLYEDSVYFPQTGAPVSIFYYVMRAMLPDEYGIPIDLFYPDSIVKEIGFSLQPNWNKDKVGLVAFIQEMVTGEVLQAIVDKKILTERIEYGKN
jgi:hypothetical protein